MCVYVASCNYLTLTKRFQYLLRSLLVVAKFKCAHILTLKIFKHSSNPFSVSFFFYLSFWLVCFQLHSDLHAKVEQSYYFHYNDVIFLQQFIYLICWLQCYLKAIFFLQFFFLFFYFFSVDPLASKSLHSHFALSI